MNYRPNNRYTNSNLRQLGNRNSNQDGEGRVNNPFQVNRASPPPPAAHSGHCANCKAIAQLMCQRCGDFYCSTSCQKNDWAKHRYICFQMPKLIHSSMVLAAPMPVLNGYPQYNLPPPGQPPRPQTPNNNSPHKKWINPQSPNEEAKHKPQQQQQNQQTNFQKSNSVERETPTPYNGTLVKVNKAPFPPNDSLVLITSTISSNRVFLRSIENEENMDYLNILKKISNYGKIAPPLDEMPARNCFAITDFNNDGVYYRVQVAAVRSEKEIDVIYYDFGNKATKKLNELKKIPPECVDLKQYVHVATLNGVPFITDNEPLNEYLKSFQDAEARITYKDNGKNIYCDLTLLQTDENLNNKIRSYIKGLQGKSYDSSKSQEKVDKNVKQQTSAEKEKPKKSGEQKQKSAENSKPDKSGEQKQKSVEKEKRDKSAEQKQKLVEKKNSDKSGEPKQKSAVKEKPEKSEEEKQTSAKRQTPFENEVNDLKLPTQKTRSEVSVAASIKTRPSQLAKPVFAPPFETVLLPKGGKNLEIFVVDNSLMQFGYFSCLLKKDMSNLQEIQSYLRKYEDNGRPYKPRVEEYCLAMFQDDWYRAKVLNIVSPEEVEVVFIDFLNESQVPVSAVRRYPMNLTNPCKTSLCMIYDLPTDLSDDVLQFLSDKLSPSSEHVIDEVKGMEEGESNVVVVKMTQVTEWLSQ